MALLVTQCGREAQCSNAGGMDRFSILPEPIIHHIFSFLEMDDIARIAVVSKRGRQLFVSSPYLVFVSKCLYDGPPDSCKQFCDRVDGLLSQRNGLEIRCLCLDWYCHNNNCDADVDLIERWINVAVNCQVQEIHLRVGIEKDPLYESDEHPIFELPQSMYSSETLRVLKLDLDYKRLIEPVGVLVSLEELSLTSLVGSDSEDVLKKLISTVCPSLKRLSLFDLADIDTLSINHPCLEELTLFGLPYNLLEIDIATERLQKLSLDLNSLFPGRTCTMKINAPNLRDLEWTARTANNICLSQFKVLNNATLYIRTFDDYVEEVTICNRITELLQSVCCTRVLELNSDVLENQFLHNRLSMVFDHLQHLVITADGCLRDYHFPVLASILSQSPNLETLSLSCSENVIQSQYAKKLELSTSKLCKQDEGFHNRIGHQLRAIEIELKGKGHQVVAVEYIIKIAKGLKKMTIICSKENLISLSMIGLCKSRKASLPFELNLVEKEFHIEEHCRIPSQIEFSQ